MTRVLVEGFERDSVVLARMLVREGYRVTLAATGDATQQALELRAAGVTVRARAALDTEPGHYDQAFLDVWTPEVAPRVALLRESGCAVRCLGDLVLERATVPTIGVTGTAGKTTTAAFLTYLLRSAGVTVHASTTARAANLWPTAELLPLRMPKERRVDDRDAPRIDDVAREIAQSFIRRTGCGRSVQTFSDTRRNTPERSDPVHPLALDVAADANCARELEKRLRDRRLAATG